MKIKYISLIVFVVVCCLGVSALATTNKYLDSSGYQGSYLGKNYLQATDEDDVTIICKELYLHQDPSETSPRLKLLSYDRDVKLISSTDGWLQVKDVFMNGNEYQSITGWLNSDYCVCAAPFYIAQHPTKIRIAPKADASIIGHMYTYDDLRVLYEINGYYCVSINAAVGFVEKESGQED